MDHLLVVGRGPSAAGLNARDLPTDAVLVTEATYVMRDVFAGDPLGVLLGDRPDDLAKVAERFHAAPAERRPLLMHAYLPGPEPVDFVSAGLPRPVPILPQLIRQGYYTHRPGQPYPTTGVFLTMLAIALGKQVDVVGVDLYQHPSGKVYANDHLLTRDFTLPARHSRACDLAHLRQALTQATASVRLTEHLQHLIEEAR